MGAPALLSATMTADVFLADTHAAKYGDMLRAYPDAFRRLFAILSDPREQAELLAAERFGHPALSGVVERVEADPHIAAALGSPSGPRFRQTVGVAVRLTMEALGWSTTGRKGPVKGAGCFKRAERYRPPAPAVATTASADRARAALDAVANIGDEVERAATAGELLRSLAETRRTEGRPF